MKIKIKISGKRITALLFAFAILLASCRQQSAGFVSGPGDVEPPHYTQESELVKYLREMQSDSEIDCYYKTVTVPDDLTFAYIRPQNIYIGWYYNYPDADADYPYFTWTAHRNGQERLEFCIENDNLQRIKDTGYYYSIVPNNDWPDIKAICAVVWVEDNYDFRLNIPVSYAAVGDKIDIDAINKYTRLEKIPVR